MPDINKSYSWAIETCNAPNVGYSQAYRNAQTVGGITYYDCSSFINYALLAGGFTTPNYAPKYNAFTTYTEADVLLSLGFKEVNASGEYLPVTLVFQFPIQKCATKVAREKACSWERAQTMHH